jgi:hypothetical protein
MAQAFPVTGASSGVEEEVHAVLQRSIAGSLAWIVGHPGPVRAALGLALPKDELTPVC